MNKKLVMLMTIFARNYNYCLKGLFNDFYIVHIKNHSYFKIIIYYLYCCLSQYIVRNIQVFIIIFH